MPKRDQKSVANVTSNLEKHKREVIENGRFKIQKKKRKTQQHAFSFSQKMGYDEPKMGRNSHRKRRKTFRRGDSVKGYWFLRIAAAKERMH